MMLCHACQKPITFVDKLGFRAECKFCRADAHVCKNCDFYDPKIYNECRETAADRVTQKDQANYCEYFIPSTKSSTGVAQDPAAEAKKKLEALFGKK